MKLRIFLSALTMFLFLLIGWIAILVVAPRPVESRWIDSLYRKKELLAQAVNGPRVILIGGSSTHFSFSAEAVSRRTGLSVFNLGSHAGLGAEYLLERSERTLRPGDLAVLALEHQLLVQSAPSTVLANFVMTTDRSYLLRAPARELLPLLFGYSPSQLIRQIAANSMPWTSPLYRPETITRFGDESANTPQNKLPYMQALVREGGPIKATQPDASKPATYIRAFVNWAREHKVKVAYVWPPTVTQPEYSNDFYTAYFDSYRKTFEAAGIFVLGDQKEFLLPQQDMLDSMYHADSIGAALASEALARNLCYRIECPNLSWERKR
jgi:hypothetical protein